jgi:hypothetical protein
MCHDEKRDCTNLATTVELMFPEANDNLTVSMRKVIKPYLDVRADLGENIMTLIYELEKGEDL